MCLNCFGIDVVFILIIYVWLQSKISLVKAQFNDCSVIKTKQIISIILTCIVPCFVCLCETNHLKNILLLLLIQTSDLVLL